MKSPGRPDDLRNVPAAAHDIPLREDVGKLGALVGEMLAEQGGEAFFERVEALRTAAIERREAAAPLDGLHAMLAGAEAGEAETLARAFATWFNVVNIAERVHRIRRRRDYQRAGAGMQPESLLAVLSGLRQQGVTADELLALLDRLDVEPVFTAHPTEAVRRSLLEKEQEIVRALVADFNPARTPQERHADRERIRDAITISWQTADASSVRPSVQDEFDHVSFYLIDPLYRVLPVLHESLQNALRASYGIDAGLPRFLRFGSWVGGDMDGNPNVGADTIRETLRTQRALVLGRYQRECGNLARQLSQSRDRIAVSAALLARLDEYRLRLPEAAEAIRPRHADMPYRCLLALIRARLELTRDDAAGAYPSVAEFASDLELIASSLASHKGQNAGLFPLQRLQTRVRCFGFHLARLDVRQDSRVHDDALAVLLEDPDWAAREPTARAAALHPHADGSVGLPDHADATVCRLRDVFATLADARQRYGSEATGPYIISMARSAADVLAVLALARYGGLTEMANGALTVPLDIAPLFETVDDLRHGSATLRALLDDPLYRAHLTSRDNRQIVMLGYSDSAKDGGILAARWALQRAQVELLAVAQEYAIGLTFFHGRGGSASRGGGKVTPALMASPRGAVAGTLRVTEQGEVIHRKYGIRALALRELEQTVGAVVRASLRPREADPREADWQQRMARLSAWSRESWRELVDDEGFVDWFRAATPIDVIERMAMSSRPASRRAMRGVEDLRAIPWVFAWTQCRAVITGWYGLGSALERGAAEFGEAALVEMARDWPFMTTLLDDVEMVLAKTDLGVAAAYSCLAGDAHARFFPRVEQEFARTVDWLARLKDQSELLAQEPRLANSIRLRNPYIDPISVLQIDLLARWRRAGREDEALLRALVATVNGVSRGLQNTG
ncbi:MAG TPA: phosphoenolpyruvate carboxylase [Rhodanobacteraceae bacterium]|nr:phosphoenolpyruvate carboxylase [Rhodanobacteraceae bacterium]